ncbi:TadE/TadG family type IV pilus assembly protein [Catelliglobosispora koreensis]|uniref:TadE/TadG family type IV pilus assembly protein n=1 Tax=Catelliglobosispora koreensis TaxID=129052 RepID=UPI000370EFFB|nr:TadE/TadG family type IV pilus assembly protein [Catelliglobosispora koreensis]
MKRRDRGSAALELAILAPAVIAIFVVVVIAGRVVIARQVADAAAFSAARTASLTRTASAAATEGDAAAREALKSQGIECLTLTVAIDTSEFSAPIGASATVTARVTCVANLGDVALPGMPGTLTLVSEFTSPIDRYRSRS